MTKREAGRETMTIRVTPRTNSALNIVVNKLKAKNPGNRVTQDDVIWDLLKKQEPEVAKMVERAAEPDDVNSADAT